MKQSLYQKKIHTAVHSAKEELLNSIVCHFELKTPVRLVSSETIYMGALGAFAGSEIVINRHLPLFWQLLILEHEIGHYYVLCGKNRSEAKIIHSVKVHPYSSEEQRAWQWVEDNPIAPGTFVDRAVRKYIGELKKIGKTYGHLDEVMRVGWWY